MNNVIKPLLCIRCFLLQSIPWILKHFNPLANFWTVSMIIYHLKMLSHFKWRNQSLLKILTPKNFGNMSYFSMIVLFDWWNTPYLDIIILRGSPWGMLDLLMELVISIGVYLCLFRHNSTIWYSGLIQIFSVSNRLWMVTHCFMWLVESDPFKSLSACL